MIEYTIARRYVGSLANLFDKSEYFAAYEQLIELAKGIEDTSSFRDFFENPLVSYEDKKKVLEASMNEIKIDENKETYEKVKKYIVFLLKEERLSVLNNIIILFKDKVDEVLNVVTLNVKTSHSVSKQMLDKIKAKFEKILNKDIRIIDEIDKQLIGGITIQYGDIIYDGSLLNQMKKLFKEFV